MNAAVDVRFSGKIDDRARLVLGEQLGDKVEIADPALDEDVARIVSQCGQVFEIAGVGQRVEVDDRFIRPRQPVEDEIATYEAGAAGDKNLLHGR